MVINYPNNDSKLIIQYHHTKTGPDVILVHYKHISQFVFDIKGLKKILGPSKFLDSSKQIYSWVEELISKYTGIEIMDDGRPDTSFASEVENDDPTSNTKMIV